VSDDVEAKIRILEQREAEAFLTADVAMLADLWHPDLIVNAPHGRIMDNAKATIDLIVAGRLKHKSVTRVVEEVRIFSNVAVALGHEVVEDEEGPMAGPPFTRRYTNTWKQDGTRWRLIARHANIALSAVR
jgi:ketosteroid isomerase-like protein